MGRSDALLLVLFGAGLVTVVYTCNNAICGPRVSKCMLIKCCGCDMSDLKNCSCCRDCQICLKSLYTECCSCVGLCPPPSPDDGLLKTSSVEDLKDPIPELFNVLTEEEDPEQRWTTYTFAVDLDKLLFKPGVQSINVNDKDEQYSGKPSEEDDKHSLGIQNCTTAFFSDCLSIAKCKASCKSMGAAKYRWFHDSGCCQCVGTTCFDYGLSNPQCLRCPGLSAFKERYLYDMERSQLIDDDIEDMGRAQASVDTF